MRDGIKQHDHEDGCDHDLNLPLISDAEAKERVRNKPHPKVTEDSIKAKIADVGYLHLTADDGVSPHGTLCIITMKNGWISTGFSAPASLLNYDAEVGQRYAFDNAFKPLWQLEGYLLREQLANEAAFAKLSEDLDAGKVNEGTDTEYAAEAAAFGALIGSVASTISAAAASAEMPLAAAEGGDPEIEPAPVPAPAPAPEPDEDDEEKEGDVEEGEVDPSDDDSKPAPSQAQHQAFDPAPLVYDAYNASAPFVQEPSREEGTVSTSGVID